MSSEDSLATPTAPDGAAPATVTVAFDLDPHTLAIATFPLPRDRRDERVADAQTRKGGKRGARTDANANAGKKRDRDDAWGDGNAIESPHPLFVAPRAEHPITAVAAARFRAVGGVVALAVDAAGTLHAHAAGVEGFPLRCTVKRYDLGGPIVAMAMTGSQAGDAADADVDAHGHDDGESLLVALATSQRLVLDVLHLRIKVSHKARLVAVPSPPAPPLAVQRTLALAFHPDGTLATLEIPNEAILRSLPAAVYRKRFGR
jgi:hypothetical protein